MEKIRQTRFKTTMKKAVVAAALAFSMYFMSSDVQAVPKKAKGPQCSAELVAQNECNEDYNYSDKKKTRFCVRPKDKNVKALRVLFDAEFLKKIFKLEAEKIELVSRVNGDIAAEADISGEKKTWECLGEKQAEKYVREKDVEKMGGTGGSPHASEPSIEPIGPMDSKDNVILKRQIEASVRKLLKTIKKMNGNGKNAELKKQVGARLRRLLDTLSKMENPQGMKQALGSLEIANLTLEVYLRGGPKSYVEVRKKLQNLASEVKKTYDLLQNGKERVIPDDEGSERMITPSTEDTQAEETALKAARENAEKILKQKPSDAVLAKARAELLKMETSLLASIVSVSSTHQFMPAYKPWRKAHDILAEESQTKKELEGAKQNLDNAGTALKGLKKQVDTFGDDAVKAKGYMDGLERSRSAQKNAAALKSEIARVKRFIEKAKLSEEQRKELIKELETSKTSSVEIAKKIEKKAMQREIIARGKSYTPNGNGATLSDQAELLEAIAKVYGRTAKADYSLEFRAKVYVRIDVDDDGKMRKVTFVKGPRAYLESENLCKGIANALGKFVFPKEQRGKTIETNFSF